jgi:hypothetical protein
LTPEQIKNLSPIFSAMAVFETWISADDRAKEDASLINGQAGATIRDPVGLALFDYAFSMSKYWTDANSAIGKANSFFPLGAAWDEAAGKDIAGRIARLDRRLIESIVSRIPANYLTDLKKSHICANLIIRASGIHALMGIK